ncbi:SRPBCC family protein [Natrinema salaciae]|uniref:Polyketide cyclase / dehydrase and lipid transport n=1 Tax=Natrinema salaciae TaxID=1186196 RepID=A0A1H9P459_9EURY|nr:SRPBCC family protein [Natrinema salaciae]SER42619.1 Polyketide cyclase / dehydrase and lipid transport [Natrinema salaciae]
MHNVSVEKVISVPAKHVWTALDEFGHVSEYNPHVATSKIIDGPETGVGATRECVFEDGDRIEEEIIEYSPESNYTVEFIDVGSMPLKRNRVQISVEERGDATAVTMAATFKPKYGFFGTVMAKLMMESRFRKTFEEVLDGLEAYVIADREGNTERV